tara:strand:+ start:1870 stop:2085 length:216 start_codon:yes stop_codon:yes gene_type:complete
MNAITINKYRDLDLNALNEGGLKKLKRDLECDISWTEHELKNNAFASEVTDLLLDNLSLFKKLLKQVSTKM